MINKCLFPAAGYGTHFLPVTKAVPKEMLPVLTKPLLQYGVEEALNAGIANMAIMTGRGKRAIEDHFDNSFELESQLNDSPKAHLLKEIKDVVQQCFSVVGKELFIDEKPETPGSPSRRVPDMTKTSSLLGYESQVSIQSGVVKTYEWYRKNVFDQDLENAF